MNSITSVMSIVLVSLLAPLAFAQSEKEPVLMDKAPFHVPIFSNEQLILLSINIPPGRDTGFHTHYADSVTVNMMQALRTDQLYGSSDVSAPASGDPVPGRVSFTDISERGVYTHKASNLGPTPFHGISFILRNEEPAGASVSDRSGVAGYTQIMDNNRVRAWRVTLEPGQETGTITQTAPGLRVYVRGGVLDEAVSGAEDRGMAPYDGDFMWQDAGQTRRVKNTGASVVEFVEFELK